MMTQMLMAAASGLGASLPTPISVATDYPTNAIFTLNSNGTWSTSDGQNGTWMAGGTGADYRCRAYSLTGNSVSGTFDSYLQLNGNRSWTLTAGVSGDRNSSFTVEISLQASPNTVLATATINLNTTGTA